MHLGEEGQSEGREKVAGCQSVGCREAWTGQSEHRASQSTGSGEPAQEEGEETAGLEINQGGCDCRPEQSPGSCGDDHPCLGGA